MFRIATIQTSFFKKENNELLNLLQLPEKTINVLNLHARPISLTEIQLAHYTQKYFHLETSIFEKGFPHIFKSFMQNCFN